MKLEFKSVDELESSLNEIVAFIARECHNCDVSVKEITDKNGRKKILIQEDRRSTLVHIEAIRNKLIKRMPEISRSLRNAEKMKWTVKIDEPFAQFGYSTGFDGSNKPYVNILVDQN